MKPPALSAAMLMTRNPLCCLPPYQPDSGVLLGAAETTAAKRPSLPSHVDQPSCLLFLQPLPPLSRLWPQDTVTQLQKDVADWLFLH